MTIQKYCCATALGISSISVRLDSRNKNKKMEITNDRSNCRIYGFRVVFKLVFLNTQSGWIMKEERLLSTTNII